MSNDPLFALYAKQQIVRDRNSSALLRWAAYITAEGIPITKPDEATARNIILAQRMPEQLDGYTHRTLNYFLMYPAVTSSVYQWLNAFNPPDLEDQLSNQNDAIISGFISRFAESDVSDQQVQDWYTAHGFA